MIVEPLIVTAKETWSGDTLCRAEHVFGKAIGHQILTKTKISNVVPEGFRTAWSISER